MGFYSGDVQRKGLIIVGRGSRSSLSFSKIPPTLPHPKQRNLKFPLCFSPESWVKMKNIVIFPLVKNSGSPKMDSHPSKPKFFWLSLKQFS